MNEGDVGGLRDISCHVVMYIMSREARSKLSTHNGFHLLATSDFSIILYLCTTSEYQFPLLSRYQHLSVTILLSSLSHVPDP